MICLLLCVGAFQAVIISLYGKTSEKSLQKCNYLGIWNNGNFIDNFVYAIKIAESIAWELQEIYDVFENEEEIKNEFPKNLCFQRLFDHV